jgi:hypothetical protein
MEWTSLKYTVYSQFTVLHDSVDFLFPRALIVKYCALTPYQPCFFFFHSSVPQIPPIFGDAFCSSINFALNINKASEYNFRERVYGNVMDETDSISRSILGFGISGVQPRDSTSRQVF